MKSNVIELGAILGVSREVDRAIASTRLHVEKWVRENYPPGILREQVKDALLESVLRDLREELKTALYSRSGGVGHA